MKTICNTKRLLQAVQLSEKMSGKQLSLPSLQGILLKATGDSLKITSTNLNVGIEIEIPSEITEEGLVLIRGEILSTILSNSNQEKVTLELENNNLKVSTITSKNVIKSLPLEDFPTLPEVEGQSFFVESKFLSDGIRSVYFSASTTDIKPEISSIFIYSDDSGLVFVGTDSFRLAEKKIKIKNLPEIQKILIPYKNVNDFLKVLDDCDGQVKITYNKNQLSLSTSRVYFTSRIIDGAFPDYRMIIPKESKTKVVILKQELLSALRMTTIFVDKFFQIIFNVSLELKKVTISSKNSDVGTSETVLSAAIEGGAIETSFNLKYFLDVFQSINGDSISIEFTETNRPIIIKSINDTSFLYLLMPANR